MAFKMKRTGVSLRSTTRVAPQLTQYQGSSPFQQAKIEVKDVDDPNDPVNIEGVIGAKVENTEFEKDNNSSGGPGACDKNVKGDNLAPDSEACLRYKRHDKKVQTDPCYQYMGANPSKTCGKGYTLNPNPTPGDRSTCCMQVTEGSEEEVSNVTGNYTSPGQMQPLTHILNPREMRRNQRMMRIGSDGDERLIKKANKNIRQAIRRGQEPNANDLAIISGQALGNYDGLNMKQDSSGYQDWFTGQQFKSVQTMPGGEMSEPENFNDLVRNKAKSLYEADPSKYANEAELLEAAEKATQRERTILGDGTDDRVKEGKYLNRKTRRLMENRNYDTSNFGEFGKRGKSQKRRDREKRQVTDLRKKASADNISQKKKDRLNRKIREKGGTPVKMSIELTRPSYKMKGFGK